MIKKEDMMLMGTGHTSNPPADRELPHRVNTARCEKPEMYLTLSSSSRTQLIMFSGRGDNAADL